ncbi:MAG: DUF6789 family protein [Sulfitobacter sp.]
MLKIRNEILRNPIALIGAGVVATVVLAIFMEGVARLVLGGAMKPAVLICQILGLDSSMLWVGEILHYGLGIIGFPIGYVIFRVVTGMGSNLVSGLIWGVILWIAAGTVMMIAAGQPLFFGFGKMMWASLVAHLAYGGVLGAFLRNSAARD